jgi:3-phenylpropionate/cinnamic acid dioxygenase small subunit
MKNSRTLNCGPIARLGSLVLACALLSPAVARAQQSSSAVRIHRLEDIEEIRTVLTDYGRYLDAHDLVAYSHLFASDGEWVGGFGTGKGPTGIQTLMERNLGVTAKAKPGSTYHLLTNFLIDVQGDTATAWSRWTFVVTSADNKPSIMYGGHYDDTLVREDGRWKFKRRVAINDIPQSDTTPAK